MATLEELARIEAETLAAEAQALRDLADYLREAVVPLPAHSWLAQLFARYAPKFDKWAQHRGHEAEMAALELSHLLREIGRGD